MKRKIITAFSASVILLFAVFLIPHILIESETDGLTYSDVSSVPHTRTGLVLGCPKKLSGGRENIYFSARIDAAAALFRAGKVDYLIVSGDNVSRGCNETVSMRTDLIEHGIPADRIYCDYRGMRTLDSVVRAKDIFGQNDMIIISQEFHNRRAIFIAGHRGINAIGFNAQDVELSEDVMIHLRELVSRLRAALDIYIFGSEPSFTGEKMSIGMPGKSKTNCVGQ